MNKPSILVFAGSTRKDSYNKKLARLAVKSLETAGARATFLDLCDYPMPLFDEDLEKKGMPEPAQKFKQALLSHQGILIASPEYNSSVTAVLKNAIDWASRTTSDTEDDLSAFKGKVASMVSASPGGLGGLRGLVHLRSILGNIGVIVLPTQLCISTAHEAFAEDGSLRDKRKQTQLEAIAQSLTRACGKLNA